MKSILLALFLLPALAFGAESLPNPELLGIQAQLNIIQQQENSLFQEFQMLQALLRLSAQAEVQSINYDDRVQAQQQREQRVSDLAAELTNRYSAYRQLEEQKAPLLQRLRELSLER